MFLEHFVVFKTSLLALADGQRGCAVFRVTVLLLVERADRLVFVALLLIPLALHLDGLELEVDLRFFLGGAPRGPAAVRRECRIAAVG